MAPSPRFHEILKELATLHDSKNSDYAGEDDPFANFRVCEKQGVSAFAGCIVRMGDKFSRIQQLTRKGDQNRAVKDESLIDTLRDNAVYSVIAICLLEEQQATQKGMGDNKPWVGGSDPPFLTAKAEASGSSMSQAMTGQPKKTRPEPGSCDFKIDNAIPSKCASGAQFFVWLGEAKETGYGSARLCVYHLGYFLLKHEDAFVERI